MVVFVFEPIFELYELHEVSLQNFQVLYLGIAVKTKDDISNSGLFPNCLYQKIDY